MNKETNRSAAGLRRSALAEKIRLREEWSALKEIDNTENTKQILNTKVLKNSVQNGQNPRKTRQSRLDSCGPLEVLVGTVALVEVGTETRALPLRAALSELGATVVPKWSPLVTHVIWSEGGCRQIRAKARAFACRLVSPLWVEACAAEHRRLSERAFPAAPRPSDLPSPGTLTRLLKKAEMENIVLLNLLSDSSEDDGGKKMPRLRISSDTSVDKSTDTSKDTSCTTNESHDQSADETDVESRVNTAPRRAHPRSVTPTETPPRPAKSRRKLFTQKEPEILDDSATTEEEVTAVKPKPQPKTHKAQKSRVTKRLYPAERLARKLVATPKTQSTQTSTNALKPRIVLSGMSKTERRIVTEAIKQLNGRIRRTVNKKTTHVLLGSCKEDHIPIDNLLTNTTSLETINRPGLDMSCEQLMCRTDSKIRTLNTLLGAARGCRVLYGQWALDSLKMKKWLHHHSYEVPHLKKMSQKARIERTAFQKMHSNYAYDVFCGIKVKISPTADQKDAAKQLLILCGAVIVDNVTTQNGGSIANGCRSQDGGVRSADCDLTIGTGEGEVSSKWVFDSVAATRMRNTKKYVNKDASVDALSQIMENL